MRGSSKRNGDVTIYDVARLAGVSTASVSRVLNNTRVKPDVQAKVEEAIAKLGFRRNLLASALTTKKTGTVGLLVPDVRNPFYAEVVRAVEDAATKRGFSTVICNTDQDSWRQREYLELLRSRGADGVIAFTQASIDTYLVELVGQRFPLVLMDRGSSTEPGICLSGVDNHAGGRIAVEHLLELGHRSIGVIAENPQWLGSRERVLGCEAAARDGGLTKPLPVVYTNDSTVVDGLNACRELLNLSPGLSAVVCGNDILAIGALAAARERGYAIPAQFSVVGFDGSSFIRALEPQLTTVAQPTAQMCEVAVDMLLTQINGDMPDPQYRVFLPVLWEGRSSGPVQRDPIA